jgi:CheY-like chemotaxis protein
MALPADICETMRMPFLPKTHRVIRKALPAPARRTSPSAGARQGLQILLVEDNPSNQMVATLMLKSAGYVIDCVDNGLLGVNALRDRDYDVVLMDLHMPVMDGIEATREIRKLEGREFVPIIGLTASALKSDRQACLDAGMTDHLGKPVDWPELIKLLKGIEDQVRQMERVA